DQTPSADSPWSQCFVPRRDPSGPRQCSQFAKSFLSLAFSVGNEIRKGSLFVKHFVPFDDGCSLPHNFPAAKPNYSPLSRRQQEEGQRNMERSTNPLRGRIVFARF